MKVTWCQLLYQKKDGSEWKEIVRECSNESQHLRTGVPNPQSTAWCRSMGLLELGRGDGSPPPAWWVCRTCAGACHTCMGGSRSWGMSRLGNSVLRLHRGCATLTGGVVLVCHACTGACCAHAHAPAPVLGAPQPVCGPKNVGYCCFRT